MPRCSQCGGEIIFRYVGGVCTPIHLSGGCYESSASTRVAKPKRSASSSYTYDSFVNPHATCPVCGQEVFYYQSANGSRVFFDALGPPWPKHPCTDNPSVASRVVIKRGKESPERKVNKNVYAWQSVGWEPIYVLEVKEAHNNNFISIHGIFKGNNITVYVRNDGKFPKQSPMHLREKDSKSYELSTISGHNPTKENLERRFIAYLSLQLAYLHSKSQKKSKKSGVLNKLSIKHSSKKQNMNKKKFQKLNVDKPKSMKKKKTAMEIAFDNARDKA